METEISGLKEQLRILSENYIEDRKGITELRVEVNELKIMVKLLTERFPMNIDRATAYAAQKGVIDGFRELVKPKPEPGLKRIRTTINKLLKGVKK